LVAAGRGAKVIGILQDMARRHPAEGGLGQRLARLLLAQKRQSEAIEVLDRLGEAQLEAGQRDQAITTLEQIVQLQPSNSASYRHLLKQLRDS